MTDITLQKRLHLYQMMHLIRRTEEVLMAEYHPANQMRCPIHFCVGQEAMPAALSNVMRRDDVLMSHYRSHGYYLAKGAPLPAMIAEFYGKACGANLGVAGSMELGAHDHNFYSGAIVAGSLFIPLGSAFAQSYRGLDNISISVIGDGVFDEGVTYEVFNLAALHRLPLLIICENNKYAAHTPVEKRLSVPLLAERARAFGLPALKLDGNNPELLLQTLEKIVPEIRAGAGPQFIEIETYRHCGHVGPGSDDDMAYRPAEEIAAWIARDPLVAMRKLLSKLAAQSELENIDSEIEIQIAAAVAAAKKADFPDFSTIVATNSSGEYSALIKRFIQNPTTAFVGGQPEARLGPF